MPAKLYPDCPSHQHYDVVIVGGAIIGSSIAWFLSSNPDFTGSILVIERDPSYEFASTSRTNSCVRQQFSSEINIRISQFTAEYVKDFRANMGGDSDIPHLVLDPFGYMYMADNDDFAQELRTNQKLQASLGAGTKIMTPEEIVAAYPFYSVDDLILGSHNLKDEGYFEGSTMFEWWRRSARKSGAEYIHNEAVEVHLNAASSKIEAVTLASSEKISCGILVNAAGPRAAQFASLANISLPVEPRKRFTWIFSAETPLDRPLPLTIDPSGIHLRQYGKNDYMAGSPPLHDGTAPFEDFEEDHTLWETHVWPLIAGRIPQFEAIRVTSSWAGHYAYNVLDHNAILGPHTEIDNFIFANGFSGHGLQQSPAVGRGISEIITYGRYLSLDLSSFSYQRIAENRPLLETAII